MRINEFDLAAALVADTSAIAGIVRDWKKRAESKGFSPYGHVVRNVLTGCMNPQERQEVLTRVRAYNERVLPARNVELIERTWEFFDSMGGEVSGSGTYSAPWPWPGVNVRISSGYLYRLPGLEYVITNWFKSKAPSEKMIRATQVALALTRPVSWPTHRVPAVLIVDSQDLRLAGPVAPRYVDEFEERIELIQSYVS